MIYRHKIKQIDAFTIYFYPVEGVRATFFSHVYKESLN